VRQGIPAVWRNPNGQQENPFNRLGYHPDNDESVTQADICWRQNNLPSRTAGILVAIYPKQIKLPWGPVAPDLNFWPGGEHLERHPVLSSNCKGMPRARWPDNRYEIFLLLEGESMLVCDHMMGVGTVSVKNGTPLLQQSTPLSMVGYIAGIGMGKSSHRQITWAIRNIEAIVQANVEIEARKQLHDLRQRLQVSS